MKIRFTVGNIVGVLAGVVGVLVNQDVLQGVPADLGDKIILIGGAILSISKGLFSSNTSKIPKTEKVEAGPVVLQKTLVK